MEANINFAISVGVNYQIFQFISVTESVSKLSKYATLNFDGSSMNSPHF